MLRSALLILVMSTCVACGGAAPPGAAPPASPEMSAPSSAAMAPEDAGGAAPETEPVEEPTATDGELLQETQTTTRPRAKKATDAPGFSPPPANAMPSARPLAAVSTAVEGKVGRGELEEVVAKNLERFRPCATDDASVELEVTVSGGGSVTGVKALRSRPDNAKLRDCVVDAFRGIAFQRGAGSETSTITFELALNRPAF